MFDSTGPYLTTIGVRASGTNSAQFNNVSSVAVDNAGNVYVSDNRNSRIQKFVPRVPDWLQVNINGFGNPSAVVVSLEIFNGQLYAGTGDWEYGTQLWRTSDGNTWEPVTQSGSGIGEGNFAILDMIEFDGKLYVGTGWNPNANAELWRTTSGEDWEPVLTFGADTASIDSLGVFGNQIPC